MGWIRPVILTCDAFDASHGRCRSKFLSHEDRVPDARARAAKEAGWVHDRQLAMDFCGTHAGGPDEEGTIH